MSPHVAPRRIAPDVVIIQLGQRIGDKNEHPVQQRQRKDGQSSKRQNNAYPVRNTHGIRYVYDFVSKRSRSTGTVRQRLWFKLAEPYAGCMVITYVVNLHGPVIGTTVQLCLPPSRWL